MKKKKKLTRKEVNEIILDRYKAESWWAVTEEEKEKVRQNEAYMKEYQRIHFPELYEKKMKLGLYWD